MVTTVVIKVVTRPICKKPGGVSRLGTVVSTKIGLGYLLQVGKWREKSFAGNKRSEKRLTGKGLMGCHVRTDAGAGKGTVVALR